MAPIVIMAAVAIAVVMIGASMLTLRPTPAEEVPEEEKVNAEISEISDESGAVLYTLGMETHELSVPAGVTLNINGTVENKFPEDKTVKVSVMFGPVPVMSKTVTIPSNSTAPIDFKFTVDKPGTYDVKLKAEIV